MGLLDEFHSDTNGPWFTFSGVGDKPRLAWLSDGTLIAMYWDADSSSAMVLHNGQLGTLAALSRHASILVEFGDGFRPLFISWDDALPLIASLGEGGSAMAAALAEDQIKAKAEHSLQAYSSLPNRAQRILSDLQTLRIMVDEAYDVTVRKFQQDLAAMCGTHSIAWDAPAGRTMAEAWYEVENGTLVVRSRCSVVAE